jgi:catechol 2,3-dioxygenase-like lactoylglutathione lyase family enzyme
MAARPEPALDAYGVPSSGSPVHAATIGVADLAASVRFYVDEMGLDVLGRGALAGLAFETHWRLPADATAAMAVLGHADAPAGRLALIEFHASARELVRNIPGQRFFGLVNLNFYSDDIERHLARLERAGCRAWSRPVIHDMGEVGDPIEVMVDGPDGVILNLIQLRATRPEARIRRTMRWIADHGGYNRCGTTPVATSAHCVPDYECTIAFHTRVLGMCVRNDVVLQGEAMESFMDYPPGARSRDTYLQGAHVFGKIAVNHPLNFECVDLVPRAVAPNVGYLAQTFVVADLGAALASAATVGAAVHGAPVELDLPGLGRVRTAIVRNPGSGALMELVESG